MGHLDDAQREISKPFTSTGKSEEEIRAKENEEIRRREKRLLDAAEKDIDDMLGRAFGGK